jgi:hypothetical protein
MGSAQDAAPKAVLDVHDIPRSLPWRRLHGVLWLPRHWSHRQGKWFKERAWIGREPEPRQNG